MFNHASFDIALGSLVDIGTCRHARAPHSNSSQSKVLVNKLSVRFPMDQMIVLAVGGGSPLNRV